MFGTEDGSDVFAIPDFWKTWQQIDSLNGPSTGSPFFSNKLQGLLHDAPKKMISKADKFTDLKVESLPAFAKLTPRVNHHQGFFQLPESLEGLGSREIHKVSDSRSSPPTLSSPAPSNSAPEDRSSDDDDLWLKSVEPRAKRVAIRTWDGFFQGQHPDQRPLFISQAGPAVYDALLTLDDDPLNLKNSNSQTVDHGSYFAALLSMAFGRESILLAKTASSGFKPSLLGMRISGYSRQVLENVERRCEECGSKFTALRDFIQSSFTSQTSKCGVALASAIDQVLHLLQLHVVTHSQNPASLLQLQSTVDKLLSLLNPLERFTSQLRRSPSDEQVLSTIFHQASDYEHGDLEVAELMRRILARVSSPWIESLEEWLGTQREVGIPFSKTDLGRSKSFIKVESETLLDDFGQTHEEVDYRLKHDMIPWFLPTDLAESIYETGRNLRFIQTHHPGHPLADRAALDACRPPKLEWQYEWDAILSLEKRVNEYRDNLVQLVKGGRTKTDQQEAATTLPLGSRKSSDMEFFGLEPHVLEQRIRASMELFQPRNLVSEARDALDRAVLRCLDGPSQQQTGFDFSPHWSLLPVLSFGSLTSAQGHVVNRESLKLLFSEHGLRQHLELQRDFQLLGNGILCSRLSHALFDPDLETAERKAGTARQGGVMGLRLGGRDTWPPASSELRLALMGVLSESYESQHGAFERRRDIMSRESDELPGDLSFAVRDLSPEEIDKCMDPDSLEALDFLRLTYKPPPQLVSVITPSILVRYDRIFKHLLRVLRMLYVVGLLFREFTIGSGRWFKTETITRRFVNEANHFITTIASYFFDTGIAENWRAFQDKLNKVEASLRDEESDNSQSNKVSSPAELCQYHSRVIDRIMLSLFLRKRQQPVLKLLEDIFALVLQFVKHTRLQNLNPTKKPDEVARGEMYRDFRRKVQIFLTVCKGLTEKNRMGARKDEDGEEDLKGNGHGAESTVARLVMRLDAYEYYAKR